MNRLVLLSAVGSLLFSGCFLYIDDDDDCDFGGGVSSGDDRAAIPGQRNPESGQCEFFGGGGPWPCDSECGPCPEDQPTEPAPVPVPQPTWAFCEDQCTGLAEDSCLATDFCRAIYNPNLGYEACWGTDQTGPVRGGDCSEFDAYECSLHDDCFAVHFSPCSVDVDSGGLEAPNCEPAEFIRCGNEDNPDDPGLCYGEITCDSLPPDCPAETMPGISDGCWTGYCIPVADCEVQMVCGDITEEFSCIARSDCSPTYQGIDCVCDANDVCTCASHVFDGCGDSP